MTIAILVFVILIAIGVWAIAYLQWRITPSEIKKEIERKVETMHSEVKTWQPPINEEEELSRKVLKDIQNE